MKYFKYRNINKVQRNADKLFLASLGKDKEKKIKLDGGRSAFVLQKLILNIVGKHCACIFHQIGQVADLKGIIAPCNKKGRYKIDLFLGELEHKLNIIHQNTNFSKDLGRSA